MPITPRLLQQRLTQVGVIRLGEKRPTQSGSMRPAKLETFRITSPSESLVQAAAALLGGTVTPWQGNAGPEFEVVTKATEIAVYVPPQRIDPNFELWGKGYRSRMCDGDVERIRQTPCMCEAAAKARYEQRGREGPADGRFERTKDDCKPTTRMSLMIADISSGIGTFRLESHGWNAASELPALAEAIASAPAPIPATLRLEQRESGRLVIENGRERVDPRKYAVPVLDFSGLFTPRQAFSGQIEAAVQAAIGGAGRPAIAAEPEPSRLSADRVIELADLCQNLPQVQQLWRDAARDEVLTDAVQEVLKARGAVFAPPPEAASVVPEAPAVEPVAVEVVDVETEPDKDETWAAIMREAGKHGWKLSQVEKVYAARMGHDSSDADGWQMVAFLTALQNGEVSS